MSIPRDFYYKSISRRSPPAGHNIVCFEIYEIGRFQHTESFANSLINRRIKLTKSQNVYSDCKTNAFKDQYLFKEFFSYESRIR